MEDETLDALTALYNTYPKTQYVDYSGFIDAFQPVLGDPSMYVPQQGLLQYTPTLADITLDPTIGAYSPVVTGLLQSYPQMEQDFQSSFAVDPNTYRNFETYKRLPFDKAYWEGVVGGSGDGGDVLDLGGVDTAGTITSTIVNGSGGGTDTTTSTSGTDVITTSTNTDTTTDTITGGTGGDTSITGTDVITITGTNTTTDTIAGGTGTDTGITGTDIITLSSTDTTPDTITGSQGTDTGITGTDIITLSGTDSTTDTNTGGTGGDTGITGGDTLLTISSNTSGVSTVDGGQGTDTGVKGSDVIDITDINVDGFNINDVSTWTWTGTPFKFNINNETTGVVTTIEITSEEMLDRLKRAQNMLDNKVTDLGLTGRAKSVFDSSIIGTLTGNPAIGGAGISIGDTVITKTNDNVTNLLKKADAVNDGIGTVGLGGYKYYVDDSGQMYGQFYDEAGQSYWAKDMGGGNFVDIEGDPRGFTGQISDWLNTPLNEGLGTAGSAFNEATSFTGAEALSLGGGLLSLASALDEATPSNVFGAVAGIGASGLLGGTATTTTGTSLMAANASAAVTGASTAGAGMTTTAGTGIQGAMTASWVAPLAVALFIGEKLQADPSNKTGFGQYDAATGETTSFGMEGDKYKEKNVEASTSIASAMGGAVNNITDAFGLTAVGDILAETGNRDPLNVTYGNQESEATTTNRLNFNTESGDIQSGDGIQRWYYTNKDGFDGARLTSDLVHGTALLSLKAKANGEDSIDLANMTLPSRSADEVKNTYLSQGFDETAADALTSAARSASGATSELLGGLLLANTTNEANYLTDTERTSLLEQGYTNEQLDTMLYGTTENSLLAINELLANKKEDENND